MISFAGGYPSVSLFDIEGLQQAAGKALSQAGVLQYGGTDGALRLREQLGQLSVSRGVPCGPEDVLVTTGSQQAFDLLVRVLINPGDTVLIETPAYPAAIQALRLAGAVLVEAQTDAQGIDVEQLEHRLRGLPAAQKPKLLYTVPNFSNPGGSRLSAQRRQHLVRLALEHGFLIIEDDPYGELRFTDDPVATVFEYGAQAAAEKNPVVYLYSLSKTVAPALRIGWMVAPSEVLRRCVIAKQTVDLCTSPVSQAVASEYLALGRYAATVARATGEYRQRMECMAEELSGTLPGQLGFTRPQGGMFLWAQLLIPVDVHALFQGAVAQNVIYVPGAAFSPGGNALPAMRFSFASPGVNDIREGVRRLRTAFDQL